MQNKKKKHQSPQEKAIWYFWYEAVFLDRESVETAFKSVSKNYPKFDFVPRMFHVTTAFKPEPKHEELYGSVVSFHITRYTSSPVSNEKEGVVSENEGFIVEISSSDEKIQDYLDSCKKIWHITGSYTIAAKYTGQLDFSDVTPVDLTLKGVFGLGDSEGKLILEYEGLNDQ